jgi:hypothetical protein
MFNKTLPAWPRAAITLLALALGLLAGPAQAALVRFNFALDFSSGPLAGQTAFGSFDVDSAGCVATVCNGSFTPSGPANPIVGPTGTLLAFSVEVDGVGFDATSDDLHPDFPSIELVDNTLSRIDFMDFSGPPSLAIYGSAFGGWGGSFTNAAFDSSLIGNVRLVGDAQAIPEPSSLLLVAAAALAGFRTTRRSGLR